MLARRWVTHKFGGSSLAEADCFRRVARILLRQDPEVNPDPARGQDGYRQAVIVSAMSGMTDSLLNLVDAAQSLTDIKDGLQSIEFRYRNTAEDLIQATPAAGGTDCWTAS